MLTNPAHASLMTSLYPRDHGVYDNDSGIADGVPTLATQYQANGYATAAIINFPHLNPDVANLGQGFDTVQRGSLRERSAPAMTVAALELIATLPEPWFVWLHYTDPHVPTIRRLTSTFQPPICRLLTRRCVSSSVPRLGFNGRTPGSRRPFAPIPTRSR